MTKKARFFDNNQSEGKAVSLTLSFSYLSIITEDRQQDFRWSYDDIIFISEPRIAVPGVLSVITSPSAKLEIEEPRLWNSIVAKQKISKSPKKQILLLICKALIIILLIMALVSFVLLHYFPAQATLMKAYLTQNEFLLKILRSN